MKKVFIVFNHSRGEDDDDKIDSVWDTEKLAEQAVEIQNHCYSNILFSELIEHEIKTVNDFEEYKNEQSYPEDG